MATNQPSAKDYRKTRHWVELKEMGYIGASMAQINSIERRAHKLAEDVCNIEMTEAMQARREKQITEQIKHVFGGEVPHGFFINLDPRGYALKLDDEKYRDMQHPITYTDMGGYMILAPEF